MINIPCDTINIPCNIIHFPCDVINIPYDSVTRCNRSLVKYHPERRGRSWPPPPPPSGTSDLIGWQCSPALPGRHAPTLFFLAFFFLVSFPAVVMSSNLHLLLACPDSLDDGQRLRSLHRTDLGYSVMSYTWENVYTGDQWGPLSYDPRTSPGSKGWETLLVYENSRIRTIQEPILPLHDAPAYSLDLLFSLIHKVVRAMALVLA